MPHRFRSSTCSPHIRRRAIHAFRLLSLYDPDLLHHCLEALPLRLQDEDPSVKCAAIGLLEVCAQVRPTCSSSTPKYVFYQITVLKWWQNGSVKSQDAVQALLGILQQLRQKKTGLKPNQISSVGMHTLEVLAPLIPRIPTDMDAMALSILQVSSRAAIKGQWGNSTVLWHITRLIPPVSLF